MGSRPRVVSARNFLLYRESHRESHLWEDTVLGVLSQKRKKNVYLDFLTKCLHLVRFQSVFLPQSEICTLSWLKWDLRRILCQRRGEKWVFSLSVSTHTHTHTQYIYMKNHWGRCQSNHAALDELSEHVGFQCLASRARAQNCPGISANSNNSAAPVFVEIEIIGTWQATCPGSSPTLLFFFRLSWILMKIISVHGWIIISFF